MGTADDTRLDLWPACSPPASPRASTSASSTTTRSPPTSAPSSGRARSRASSWSPPPRSRAATSPRSRRRSTRSWRSSWRKGPTAEELERARARDLAGFVRGVERIGGFGGKSDVLALSQVFLGSPDAYKTRIRPGARRHARRAARGREALALGRGLRARGAPLPGVQERRRPTSTARRSPTPGTPPAGRFPTFAARQAVERPQARGGRAPRGPGRQLQPAGGRRLRRRPDGRARARPS